MTTEILEVTETEQLVTTEQELLEISVPEQLVIVERVTQREVLEVAVPERLLVDSSVSQLLTDLVREQELLEIAQQGPPGPTGLTGAQGIPGLDGEANLGGLEIYLTSPQPGDVLTLDPTNTWVNAPQAELVDGGNF